MNKIIAIVGMCGVGKSVACEFLENIGYQKVYFGGVTMEKLKEEGLDVTPLNEKMMRERLRSELGMGAYAKVLLPKIKELSEESNVVLDGLYSWDELKILKEEFGEAITVICVIADRALRYERLAKRDVRPFTNEEAMHRDMSEIENLAKGGPIAYADYYILNNGNIEEFEIRLKEILDDLGFTRKYTK